MIENYHRKELLFQFSLLLHISQTSFPELLEIIDVKLFQLFNLRINMLLHLADHLLHLILNGVLHIYLKLNEHFECMSPFCFK